ncbi:ATP-binding protein [Candidatus Woesearchaeota archaeon]|nr:ATP-binding protein [Candidatus Woesearchaeota archaeon]
MILKETLMRVLNFQKEELETLPDGIKRELFDKLDLNIPQAIILAGVRRCGKSTLLRQLMKKQEHYYLNFDDQRLASFEVEDFEKLEEIFPLTYVQSNYFFFDEIQNVLKWELFIRKLLNSRKRCIVTGSNASLLSKELGTRLTGRHFNYELFPLSYSEFLDYFKQKPQSETAKSYLELGGFPEYLQNQRDQFLQELLNDILMKDIVVRYKLRESKKLEELAIYFLTNVGKEFSYNGLTKLLGLGSTNTVISYVSYLEDCYLIFTIPRFSYSYKQQLVNPKKVYSIDNGLIRANSVTSSADQGRLLENAVYLQLRRKYKDIFYFKGKKECDFVIKEKKIVKELIQVCWEINSDNQERELSGLKEAAEELKCEQQLIITFNQEDKLGDVKLIPFWRWASRLNK